MKEKWGDIQEQQQLSLTQPKKPRGLRRLSSSKNKKITEINTENFYRESKIIDFSTIFIFRGEQQKS